MVYWKILEKKIQRHFYLLNQVVTFHPETRRSEASPGALDVLYDHKHYFGRLKKTTTTVVF